MSWAKSWVWRLALSPGEATQTSIFLEWVNFEQSDAIWWLSGGIVVGVAATLLRRRVTGPALLARAAQVTQLPPHIFSTKSSCTRAVEPAVTVDRAGILIIRALPSSRRLGVHHFRDLKYLKSGGAWSFRVGIK
jgi:hypothetical protein